MKGELVVVVFGAIVVDSVVIKAVSFVIVGVVVLKNPGFAGQKVDPLICESSHSLE
jgi:hypothetical protein